MDYFWNVTGRCNLNCQYCWDIFKKEKELDTDAAKRLIQEITSNQCGMILFTGGEPLLREDLFELVDHCRSKGIKQLKLCTNGTLVLKRVREIQASALTEIHISLDDCEENKNDLRLESHRVMQNIDFLCSNVDTNKTKVVLVSVIDPSDVDKFERVLQFAKERHIYATYQFPVLNEEQQSLSINLENLSGNTRVELFERLNDLHHKYKQELDYFSNFYYLTAKHYYLDNQIPVDCGAGIDFEIISPGGEFYSCYSRRKRANLTRDCFNPKCLIWFRSSSRARKIISLLKGAKNS